MKTCKACGEEKPLDQFHKDKSKHDGLNAYCKPCTIAKQKDYQSRPPRRLDPPGEKTCQTCKYLKPVTEFYNHKGTYDGLQRRCKDCSFIRHEAWRLNNLDKAAEQGRRWRKNNPERIKDHSLKNNYGLDIGSYDKMLGHQQGKCSICQTTDTGHFKRFHVDHNHTTGSVRGLLCHNCNAGIGHFKEDREVMFQAIAYLDAYDESGEGG